MTDSANESERERWNGERGTMWIADADHRDAVMVSVAEALLDGARLRSGERVLDVGCGCGATTLAAAQTVGPSGSVLGVDLSGPMLSVAQERVAASALTNVTLEQADAQTTELPRGVHDAAISRFGTMFFDDYRSAFTNIGASLRDGGRLAIATWQPLAANDWLAVPIAALKLYQRSEAASGEAGMFGQSDPDLVTRVLEQAGFGSIDVRPHTVPLHIGVDSEQAAEHVLQSSAVQAVLATVDPDAHDEARLAVRSVMDQAAGGDGVWLDGGILITTARRDA